MLASASANRLRVIGIDTDSLKTVLKHVWFRPTVRLCKNQVFSTRFGRALSTQVDVVRTRRKFQAIYRKLLEQIVFVETGRDDQNNLVRRSLDGLYIPVLPASLPLAAMKFQRDND